MEQQCVFRLGFECSRMHSVIKSKPEKSSKRRAHKQEQKNTKTQIKNAHAVFVCYGGIEVFRVCFYMNGVERGLAALCARKQVRTENPSQVQGESGVIFRPDRGKQIQLHSHTRTVLGRGE